ncbi:MAG: glycosyltransferase [Methylococcaceae bacterium]|nr:glycosyltransferase [Methylococcaceae bacterium]
MATIKFSETLQTLKEWVVSNNDNTLKKLHWSVDSLIFKNGTCYGFGWVFHEEKEIQDLKLMIKFANSETLVITAELGKLKDNIAADFPKYPLAMNSGYTFLGSYSQDEKQFIKLTLCGTFADNLAFEINITQYLSAKYVYVRQLTIFCKRGWYLFKTRQFASLYEKVKRYILGRPKSFLAEPEILCKKLTLNELESAVLVIDHDLGGGANHYRDRLVAEKIKEGFTIIIFSYHIPTLSYLLIIKNKRLNKRFSIPNCDFLFRLAEQIKYKEIIYNTAVSFDNPDEIPQLIIKLKNWFNPQLILLAHDFFMVCPSYFLLDDTGVFCGIPNINQCQNCLNKNQQSLINLIKSRDINEWRSSWGNVLELADEVRTFSNNTLTLFQKAYPLSDFSHAVVKPHTVDYLKFKAVYPSYTTTLRIGVVGQIGYHKGAKFIQALAQEIKVRNLNIEIIIIGSIEVQCEISVVRQTGIYQHNQLPTLIENSGVNIMLFSSICPETFSYVVQELIEMKLPIACFNFGAPAERLSNYAKGLILKEHEASLVLDELIAFHKHIYSLN